jgi:uncharacterized protein YbcV (DUF1398 family)
MSNVRMTEQQIAAVEECARLSAAGAIHFGEVIQRLIANGIERCHADYARDETTYYATAGGSCIVPIAVAHGEIADAFSASQVEAGVRQSQRGEIRYPEFTRQAVAAGCVGYFVQITGKCVQYFGRRGEIHTEWFPGTRPGT